MFRLKPKAAATRNLSPVKGRGGGGCEPARGWEVRPGGMLVQQRNSDSNSISNPFPTIKVRVKYGSSYHEVNINSQASFGELKKMLAGPTGLHPQDQKVIYKDKERDSKVFLDTAGVKNGSKLVLIEDEISREKRRIESRKSAKIEKASEEISRVRDEVDKLAKQVASIEMEIKYGKKLKETTILNLTELLMTQLIKLDGITAGGDVKLQRKMQVTRVQKYIETLDMLKMRNSNNDIHGAKLPFTQHQNKIMAAQIAMPRHDKPDQRRLENWNHKINPRPVVVTTKWETF